MSRKCLILEVKNGKMTLSYINPGKSMIKTCNFVLPLSKPLIYILVAQRGSELPDVKVFAPPKSGNQNAQFGCNNIRKLAALVSLEFNGT